MKWHLHMCSVHICVRFITWPHLDSHLLTSKQPSTGPSYDACEVTLVTTFPPPQLSTFLSLSPNNANLPQWGSFSLDLDPRPASLCLTQGRIAWVPLIPFISAWIWSVHFEFKTVKYIDASPKFLWKSADTATAHIASPAQHTSPLPLVCVGKLLTVNEASQLTSHYTHHD